MNCEQLLEVLQEYVGGELLIERRAVVEIHVSGCQGCGILVQSYLHIMRVARTLPKCSPLPPGVEERLKAAILPELNSELPPTS